MAPLLEVTDLSVEFGASGGSLRVVDGVTFAVDRGQTLGLVGESGCGKSVSSLAVMGLIPTRTGRVTATTLRLADHDLLRVPAAELRTLRGPEMAMIFQEPMTSLNPAFTVGNQIAESVRAHQTVSRAQAAARAGAGLDRVGIPDPARRAKDYPHAFSGGMRQRAMIAMALANDPKLLIADEPTTALDVTIQAQILELLRSLQRDNGMAIVFVTHDLGVVADICDRVVVMYAGQVVEESAIEPLYVRPRHPYAAGLLASMPQTAAPGEPLRVIPGQVPSPDAWPTGCRFADRCDHADEPCRAAPVPWTAAADGGVRCVRADDLALSGSVDASGGAVEAAGSGSEALVTVVGLRKEFPVRSALLRRQVGVVRAVDGVDFTIGAGETLGLVGESGSGKSTVARLVLRLIEPTAGTVRISSSEVTALDKRALRDARRDMQMVFQDPYSSLDPRQTIAEAIGEPMEVHLGVHGRARDDKVRELLNQVGMGAYALRRYPYEFSGGQRQRIAIARALALDPDLLVLDEPVSSLDVSTQSQVINLLTELQTRLGLTYLFIAHDLSVVRHISDRIAVMYLGRVVEQGSAEEVYRRPRHPYTEALLSAIPLPDPARQRGRERIVLRGDVPSPLVPPSGCHFRTRCRYAMDVCASEDPPVFRAPGGTTVACHLHVAGPTLAGAPVTELGAAVGT
ncbi:MAG: dipeptide ABC transporter ATP-binding protein [Acidimicrobiia bacterium]